MTEFLVARQEFNDTRYSIYERCATFERHMALTDTRVVKLSYIKQMFEQVARRVLNVDIV
jgi:hypothetical protein